MQSGGSLKGAATLILKLKWKQNITKAKNSFRMIDILGERAYNISTRIGGDYMLDVNMIIANNIQAELKKKTKAS